MQQTHTSEEETLSDHTASCNAGDLTGRFDFLISNAATRSNDGLTKAVVDEGWESLTSMKGKETEWETGREYKRVPRR